MATPGYTHIPRQSQTAQVRELISYISFLEAKVAYLQYHHDNCDTWVGGPPLDANAILPYLPPDVVVARDISRFPPATQPSTQSFGGNPRWKHIIDQITKGWDKSSSWEDKRVTVGLDSVEQNKNALTAILSMKKNLPRARDESPPSTFPDSISSTDALIMSAQRYALDINTSQTKAGFALQVHIFRELVFSSLCVVLEQQGLPIDTINDLMRICISSSGPANLYRLRRGALWVNRVISGTMMKKMGWGRRSAEFFFICQNPLQ